MAPTFYLCKNCPLRPDCTVHRVDNADRIQHQTDIEAFKHAELNKLADLLTGLVVSEENCAPQQQQHSRLFSSRADHQVDIEIPSKFGTITAADALSTVNAVWSDLERPELHPAAARTRNDDQRLLSEALHRIRSLQAVLDVQRALSPSREEQTILHRALEDAGTAVVSASRLLASIKAPDSASPRREPLNCDDSAFLALVEELTSETAALDALVDVVGRLLPEEVLTAEAEYDTEHHFVNPLASYDIVAQLTILLTVICNVVIGVATHNCDFILELVTMIIRLTMSLGGPHIPLNLRQKEVLRQLPPNLESALRNFKLDPKTVIYATCPSCHFTHAPTGNRLSIDPSYPATCQGFLYPEKGNAVQCGASLLEVRQGKPRPIKPFVYPSFIDYIAAMVSDPEIEAMCDSACDDAFAAVREAISRDPAASRSAEFVNNVFEAAFLRSFEGPVPGKLFIERDGRMRLAFEIMVDFFNPNGTRKRGNHDSIGIIAVVNLNILEDMRYRPEFMWLSIVLGPQEPNHDQLSYYFRPIVDDFVVGWRRGFHLSRTASSPSGRSVDIAIVINVNDLPATRKAAGMAAGNSHHFCMFCSLFGIDHMHDTDFHNWEMRDVAVLREQAYKWRDARSHSEREKIFKKYGVRWSEFWRLPYWDPTQMAVVDAMHCILEGLVHHHCRRVLRIDAKVAKRKEVMGAAFTHDWKAYDATQLHPDFHLMHDGELAHVRRIQAKLQQPILEDDELNTEDDNAGLEDDIEMADMPDPRFVPALSVADLRRQLRDNHNLRPLRFVAHSLELATFETKENTWEKTSTRARKSPERRYFTKEELADRLLLWRKNKPPSNGAYIPRTIGMSQLKYVQQVITETVTPSWVDSVPRNYGESNAGTIKAGEWRILATIYVPIALVLLWGDLETPDAHFSRLLDHSMALFQAAILVCRYTMTAARARQYRDLLKLWVDGLPSLYPHTRAHAMRPNIHIAFHIYDFLLKFGPVISWWCFPFERVIGLLQRINTNNHIGGELESTLTRSWYRAAGLRRWLRRPDCPAVIKQIKVLFDKAFPSYNLPVDSEDTATDGSRAHYKRNSVNFSRAATHLGNSLVMYYAPGTNTLIPGSIEDIQSVAGRVSFTIRRQEKLPAGVRDPFRPYYPLFPAQTYSSRMSPIRDTVPVDDVLSHIARFNFSSERCVVLDLGRA